MQLADDTAIRVATRELLLVNDFTFGGRRERGARTRMGDGVLERRDSGPILLFDFRGRRMRQITWGSYTGLGYQAAANSPEHVGESLHEDLLNSLMPAVSIAPTRRRS